MVLPSGKIDDELAFNWSGRKSTSAADTAGHRNDEAFGQELADEVTEQDWGPGFRGRHCKYTLWTVVTRR